MMPLKSILHPTDFSKPSEYAFRMACSLARDHGSRLVLLHVSPPPIVVGEWVPPMPSDEYEEECKEKLWQLFRDLEAKEPHLRDLRVETRIIEGAPAPVIVKLAEDGECDMIVMGTHGRTGLTRLLLGSVAEQVLRRAPCPVLTVKAPPAESEKEMELAGVAATGY